MILTLGDSLVIRGLPAYGGTGLGVSSLSHGDPYCQMSTAQLENTAVWGKNKAVGHEVRLASRWGMADRLWAQGNMSAFTRLPTSFSPLIL